MSRQLLVRPCRRAFHRQMRTEGVTKDVYAAHADEDVTREPLLRDVWEYSEGSMMRTWTT